MNDSHRHPDKAYLNTPFIQSRDARPLRILAEYLEPKSRLEHYQIRDTIVFFGSARLLSEEDATSRLAKAQESGDGVEQAEMQVQMSAYYEAGRELARRLTEWSKSLEGDERRFVICTGGGPGIMEAVNRGASEARGVNLGLGISLPFESTGNPYVTRSLAFEFHYFFMRKFWFTYLAKAIVAMPGGFGTLDELFEILTLIQTFKIKRRLPIVLFGRAFWEEVVNFDALARYGTINRADLDLIHLTDSVDDAFAYLTSDLRKNAYPNPEEPL
jgi:uncharacterized protein (TIGR00730 family)